MDIKITHGLNEDGDCVVKVVGEIEVYTSPLLRKYVFELLEDCDVIALDISAVRYIDSTGVGVMIGLRNVICKRQPWDGQDGSCRCRVFYVVNEMVPTIRKLFSVAGLSKPAGLQIGRPADLAKAPQSSSA